jgi:uncharacterized protein YggE
MSSLRHILAAAALCVVAVAGYQAFHDSAPARASAGTRSGMPAFLRFSGTGSASIVPDRATINFTTEDRAGSLAEATNAASARMARVMAAMKARGVDRADMRTDDVSGSHLQNGGYRAQQSLAVTVTDISRTGLLIAAGIHAGALATYGPDFSVADRKAGLARALQAAVRNARAKAEVAASAAGLRVTGVVSVSEEGSPEPYYGAVYAAPARAALERVQAIPIKRGTQRRSATVTVVFSYAVAS